MQDNSILYDKQLQFEGNAYLDPKHMPVKTYAELMSLSQSQIFEGMEVTVISDETLNGDSTKYTRKNNKWQLINQTCEIFED